MFHVEFHLWDKLIIRWVNSFYGRCRKEKLTYIQDHPIFRIHINQIHDCKNRKMNIQPIENIRPQSQPHVKFCFIYCLFCVYNSYLCFPMISFLCTTNFITTCGDQYCIFIYTYRSICIYSLVDMLIYESYTTAATMKFFR